MLNFFKSYHPLFSVFKIHLGNKVWISKGLFTDKLAKLSVKNSIAMGDLMEAVWPLGGLAIRSYDGGVSPKTPNAPRKSAATPAKKEVCLGKLMEFPRSNISFNAFSST